MPHCKCTRYEKPLARGGLKGISLLAMLSLLLQLAFAASTSLAYSPVGVKVGHWMKYDVSPGQSFSYWFHGAPYNVSLEWVKAEVVAVDGSKVTVYETWHCEGEEEYFNTTSADLGSVPKSSGAAFLIAADMRPEYRVWMGNQLVSIVFEGVDIYAGASRIYLGVTFTSRGLTTFCTYDKQTGFLLQARVGDLFAMKAVETNMWGNDFFGDWRYWVAIGVVIIAGIIGADLILYRRARRAIEVQRNRTLAMT